MGSIKPMITTCVIVRALSLFLYHLQRDKSLNDRTCSSHNKISDKQPYFIVIAAYNNKKANQQQHSKWAKK